jgi:hypothetical protein
VPNYYHDDPLFMVVENVGVETVGLKRSAPWWPM